ncbi:MAG: hypothetical protein WCZ89_09235 [Phycisphaerae bacterium]
MSDKIADDKNRETKKNSTWLLEYANNVTSQYGEDGIIAKVLEVIGEHDKWCVEFGSWDGKTCSNTYKLIKDDGYSAILIEADAKRFRNLKNNFGENKKVICLNRFVGFEKENNLDVILKETPIPRDFDLLSIDIDGNDYHAWDAVEEYNPKVVVIEFNPTISKKVEFVQAKDMRVGQGSSLLAINNLAKTKGYELVAVTLTNAVFVLKKFYSLFNIDDNSVETMMTDESMMTYIFCGYDGSVFIRGYGKSPWHQITYKESKMQLLPKWAIKQYGDKNFIRRRLGKFCRRFLAEK